MQVTLVGILPALPAAYPVESERYEGDERVDRFLFIPGDGFSFGGSGTSKIRCTAGQRLQARTPGNNASPTGRVGLQSSMGNLSWNKMLS